MPLAHDVLRFVLIIVMAIYLWYFWKTSRGHFAFATYVLLLIWQAVWMHAPGDMAWWASRWLLLESAVMAMMVCAVYEAFYWSTEWLPARERQLLFSCLIGLGVWFASLVFHPPSPTLFAVFLLIRDLLYAAAFGFLLGWLMYLVIKPFSCERYPVVHTILLMLLVADHTLSRPIGHYLFTQTNAIFAPVAIVLFAIWVAAVKSLPPRVGAPGVVSPASSPARQNAKWSRRPQDD